MRGIDPEKSFPISKSALGRKQQELKSLGKGNRPNRAKCLTEEDEELLWEKGELGDSDPDVLRNTVWYLTTKLLGFRGRHESQQLLWSDLKVFNSPEGKYIEFNERLAKCRNGKNGVIREFPPKMFKNKDNPERCPIRLYKLYKSHRPTTKNQNSSYSIPTGMPELKVGKRRNNGSNNQPLSMPHNVQSATQ